MNLARSYAWCERLARREAGNFYPAFRVLPVGQRRSMCALYAFLRVADDLSDDGDEVAQKRDLLADWRQQLRLALAGTPTHPLHPALVATVANHNIPVAYLEAAIDGVEMDLTKCRYDTFEDLYDYCYRVASVVGLSCVRIWGLTERGRLIADEAEQHAERVGVAFQLTNILRDLREDAERDRVYLPRADLDHFGYDEASLSAGVRNEAFLELMRFEVARARCYYESAKPLSRLLRPAGRAVFQVMTRTYSGLLEAIEAREYDVFSGRVRLSTWHKLGLAVQALPVRWGWE